MGRRGRGGVRCLLLSMSHPSNLAACHHTRQIPRGHYSSLLNEMTTWLATGSGDRAHPALDSTHALDRVRVVSHLSLRCALWVCTHGAARIIITPLTIRLFKTYRGSPTSRAGARPSTPRSRPWPLTPTRTRPWRTGRPGPPAGSIPTQTSCSSRT